MMDKLSTIEQRLTKAGYRVARDIPLLSSGNVQLVASRAYFSWKGFVIQSQHIVVRTIESPTVEDLKTLFESGFVIGKKRNRVPLIRGMQFGYMIIPVVIASKVSKEVLEYVAQPPPSRFSLFEFPVVYDVTTDETAFFEGTPMWGAFFFSDMRNVVTEHIA